MPILTVILIIIIAGVLLWAANTYIPMADSIKKLLNIVVPLLVVLWLCSLFGLFDSLSGFRIGRHG